MLISRYVRHVSRVIKGAECRLKQGENTQICAGVTTQVAVETEEKNEGVGYQMNMYGSLVRHPIRKLL